MTRVEEYLAAMGGVWSESTLKSERSRMKRLAPHLHLNPEELWKTLQGMYKPYAAQTAYTRVVRFVDWKVRKGYETKNLYRDYRREYGNAFRGHYERAQPDLTYDDARRRISNIADTDCREKALELLTTGLRISEYDAVSGGRVKGKGRKSRSVFGRITGKRAGDKKFRQELKRVGINSPHDLRKIFAQRLVEKGVGVFDLMEVMGWSNLNTAQSYIAASRDLESVVENALGGE